VSKDELKPALSGVLFRFDKKAITSVATDGHRLVKYIIEGTESGGFMGDIIIPRKFLSLVGNLLSSAEEAKLWFGESHMTLAFGDDVYYTRIIGERFPDFDGVIPKDSDKELVIKREALLSAVRRVSVFSNRSTQQIALVLSGEKLQVTTEDPEKSSKGKENLDGKYNGEEITVGYNAGYLKDILSHMPTDEITIKLKTSISAALFFPNKETEKRDLTMLLMPIRLND
jgi:DNA polymerase-3 subunit beta